MTTPETAATIQLNKIAAETIEVPIIGTMPLLMNQWSAKARQKMLDDQQGRKSPKEIRDPQADYEASMYRLAEDRYGFPAVGFKQATVDAARFYGKSVTMTSLRQMMFIAGEMTSFCSQALVEIEGEPKMREDYVRVGRGGADLRFRAEFVDWRATLRVTFVPTQLSRASILSLIDAGGMGVGIGDWRPERNGNFGTYMIDEDRAVKVVEDRLPALSGAADE